MKTQFHRKLESMVRVTRPDGHWFIVKGETVRLPKNELDTGEFRRQSVVTTKRAIYAAFVGEIPDGFEVMSSCGYSRCVAPDHQRVVFRANSRSHGISMPDQLIALRKPKKYVEPDKPDVLPKDITLQAIHKVKFMCAQGTPILAVANDVGLKVSEVMRIRNGVYDEAAKNISQSQGRRPVSESSEGEEPRLNRAADEENLSEEERAWLKTVGR